MVRRVLIPVVVVALLLIGSVAQADLYLNSGGKQFSVRVHNSWFKSVDSARGNVWVSGNSARIDVQAPGYRDGHATVYLSPNTTHYRCDVRLDETSVTANVIDERGAYVSGAQTDTYSQSLYWGDEYGVRAYLPKAEFTKLTWNQIEVRVNHLFAFAPRVYLADQGSRWAIEAVIKRRDMGQMFNRIEIVVPRDPAPPASGTPQLAIEPLIADYAGNQTLLAKLDNDGDRETVNRRLESLAVAVRAVFAKLTGEKRAAVLQAMPAGTALRRELTTMSTFDRVHGE